MGFAHFGGMNHVMGDDGFRGFSDSCWSSMTQMSGVSQMNAGLQIGSSFGQLMQQSLQPHQSSQAMSQYSSVQPHMGLSYDPTPTASSPSSMSSSMYASPYYSMSSSGDSPVSNGIPEASVTPEMTYSTPDTGEVWRGSSLATLRQKAIEHMENTVSMTGYS